MPSLSLQQEKHRASQETEPSDGTLVEQSEEIVEQHDLNEVLQLAIQGLSPKLRGVVHLRCFGSLTFSEIGQALKMPEATAKTYFYRALPRLRTVLQNNTTISLSF